MTIVLSEPSLTAGGGTAPITAHELADLLAASPRRVTVIDVAPAAAPGEERASIPGSFRLDPAAPPGWLRALPISDLVVVTSPDGAAPGTVIRDLAAASDRRVRVLAGGTERWVAAGLLTTVGARQRTLVAAP
jgi:hypothetical protein